MSEAKAEQAAPPASFDELVHRHYAALYRFALTLSRNESDACDLTQETFYIWARKGSNLQDPAKAKSWLFTTLHREFLQRRRRFLRFPHQELDRADVELPTVPPSFGTGIDAAQVLRALRAIDEAYQGPVALFYLEDYSYKEIAGILDIPMGTVKSRISRGIAQLQRELLSLPHKSPRTM